MADRAAGVRASDTVDQNIAKDRGASAARKFQIAGTATGAHAAAIIKAEKKGDSWLADRIYSGVPAGMFGKEQEIEIGHYSSESNVVYWLTKRGYDPTKELVTAVLGAAML